MGERTPAPPGAGPAARTGIAAMVAATLVWGGTFVILRDSVRHVGPFALVFARFLVSATVFTVLLTLTRRRPAAATLPGGVLAGVFTAGCYAFQALGITATSAGSSAFLTCVGTVLAAFFAWPLLGQRPAPLLVRGILLALAGSALLSLRGRLVPGAGELWTLLGATLYALQIVVLARVAPRSDPLVLTAVQSVVVALLLAPWAPAALRDFATLDAAGWWRFAYLALPASVLAPWLQVRAQQSLPAGRVALLFALEPVFALLFALTFGGERFALHWWAGAALIVGGVLMVEWRTLAGRSSTPRRATS